LAARGDPIYEAVEVMSNERGADAPPLVVVFFTERAVPKRQVHYFNDTRRHLSGYHSMGFWTL